MTKKKPCRVEITHTQAGYIVSIDKPGSPVPYKLMDAERPNKVKRYITRWSAKRGALRNLKAYLHSLSYVGSGVYAYGDAPKITFVQFMYKQSKRRK